MRGRDPGTAGAATRQRLLVPRAARRPAARPPRPRARREEVRQDRCVGRPSNGLGGAASRTARPPPLAPCRQAAVDGASWARLGHGAGGRFGPSWRPASWRFLIVVVVAAELVRRGVRRLLPQIRARPCRARFRGAGAAALSVMNSFCRVRDTSPESGGGASTAAAAVRWSRGVASMPWGRARARTLWPAPTASSAPHAAASGGDASRPAGA